MRRGLAVPEANLGRPELFAVRVEFSARRAFVRVEGELDVFTGRQLEAVVAGLTGRGILAIDLDLRSCTFVDCAGLRVIAGLRRDLDVLAGALTVGSISSPVERLLRLTGPWAGLFAEQPDGRVELGREQSSAGTARSPEVGAQLRRVSAVPAADDVVDAALRLVVALARATVGGADGVSVSLRRRGRLSTVAASDTTILAMDADQYATGEGPCVDASVEGRWFHTPALASETRWPAFSPRAQALGINAILSSPLVANDSPVGALNIYSRTAGAFAAEDQQLAGVFAREASTVLAGAGIDVTEDEIDARLQDALESRELIAMAQGVLMERDGLSPASAYTVLRRFSSTTSMPLRTRAAEIVRSAAPQAPPSPPGREDGNA